MTATKTFAFGFFFLSLSTAFSADAPKENWFQTAPTTSFSYMMQNISAPGAAKGTVIASPSIVKPDYFYHWVRDAALIMEPVIDQYANSKDAKAKEKYFQTLLDYIALNRRLQKTENLSGGLGEPKFNADGTAFMEGWGRPQNDGPALRAVGLTRLAQILIKEGKASFVKEQLYNGFNSIIKADLEYVSHNWQHTCFDLWEEIRGHHFYTRMVKRRALVEGADLAEALGDPNAAGWYRKQAKLIEPELQRHWVANKGILTATLERDGGISYKSTGIDSAIILGVLHGHTNDGFFSYSHPQVLSTAHEIEDTFKAIYPINKNGGPGIAIGRYPEDLYDGMGWGEGNPWFITTNAFAELHHRVASELEAKGSLFTSWVAWPFYRELKVEGLNSNMLVEKNNPLFAKVIEALRARGDNFLLRSRLHMDISGSMSEQMNRNSGFMQGARDLTWSYGSLVTAFQSR